MGYAVHGLTTDFAMSSKCFDVARGECGVRGENDAGDHGVAEFAGTPHSSGGSCGQLGRLLSCCLIKSGDALLDHFGQD